MTSRYVTRLAEVCAALDRHEARYVLVGAAAAQLWGAARATRDINILIEATVENARRVLAALGDLGTFELERVPIPTASIEHLIASKRTGRLQDAADIELLEEIRRLRGGEPGP